jgi:hypothetical protein
MRIKTGTSSAAKTRISLAWTKKKWNQPTRHGQVIVKPRTDDVFDPFQFFNSYPSIMSLAQKSYFPKYPTIIIGLSLWFEHIVMIRRSSTKIKMICQSRVELSWVELSWVIERLCPPNFQTNILSNLFSLNTIYLVIRRSCWITEFNLMRWSLKRNQSNLIYDFMILLWAWVRTGKDISEHFYQQPNVGCCDHESRMPTKCSIYLWHGKLNECIFRQNERIAFEIPRFPEAAKYNWYYMQRSEYWHEKIRWNSNIWTWLFQFSSIAAPIQMKLIKGILKY